MTVLFALNGERSCFICKKQDKEAFVGHQDLVTPRIQHIFHKACLLKREKQDPDVCLTCPECEIILKYKPFYSNKRVLPTQSLLDLAFEVALGFPVHAGILTFGGALPVFMVEMASRIFKEKVCGPAQGDLVEESISRAFFALGQSAVVQKAKTKEELFFLSCLTAGLIVAVTSPEKFQDQVFLGATLALTQAVFHAVEKRMIPKRVAPLIMAPALYVAGRKGRLFCSAKQICATVPSLISIACMNQGLQNAGQPKRLMRRYYDGLQVAAIFSAVIGGYLVTIEKVPPLVALPIVVCVSAGLGSFYVASKARFQFRRSLS